MALTSDQIDALAPDAGSIAAGRKLAKPAAWSGLGQSSAALWGECKGSSLYLVQVDLSETAYKCSCPSRKLPCKHVLGLLYMAASSPDALAPGETPDWVGDWLAKRRGRMEQKAEKDAAKTEAAPADAGVRAARREKREKRVGEGLELFSLWLEDIIRTGIGTLAEKGSGFFNDQAARLVDAQASSLAGRLRKVGEEIASGPDWPERVLAELGHMGLLLEAWRRLETLPRELQTDVRTRIGWASGQDEVLAEGERVSDIWLVAAQSIEQEERLKLQRTWLWGTTSGRAAMDLQFSAGGQPFGQLLAPGTAVRGELAFWPSACPQRARFANPPETLPELPADFPGAISVDSLLDAYATDLSRLPWLERQLFCLKQATAFRHGDAFLAATRDGKTLPLAGRALWKLLAVTGGKPADLFGLWDGRGFRVGSVITAVGYTAIEPVTTGQGQEMIMAFRSLMKTAAAGTATATGVAETGSPALDAVIGTMPETSPERRLLAAAGSLAVYAAAGAEPLEVGELPPAAAADDRPAAPQRAAMCLGQLLEGDLHTLLPGTLAFMDENRVRLPESLLPDFLNVKDRYRCFVRPLLGRRGAWLAAQNPDWAWTLEEEAATPTVRTGELPEISALERIWQEGEAAERLAVLRRVRSAAPDTARAWLENTWSTEKADQRAAFLDVLKEGLGPDDVPFLEGIAGDRGQKIRRMRFLLLATMSGSSVSKGLEDHTGFLRLSRSGPAGSAGTPRMEVLAPDEPDPFWQESGISVKAPQGIGHKSWLLGQMLSLIPLDFWQDRLGASPDELIGAAQETEWLLPILEGWSRSAISMPRIGWLPALVAWWRDFRTDGSAAAVRDRLLRSELLPELVTADPAQRAVLAELLLAGDPDPALPWDDILKTLERPWPVSLAGTWLEAMRGSVKRHADEYNHAWLATLPLAAGALPDECLAGAVRQWDLPGDQESESWAVAAWRKALAEYSERIEMRRAISEEIRRICGRDGGAE